MISEANKALVRRYVDEALNRGSRQAAQGLVAPEHVNHMPYFGPTDRGVATNDRARLRVSFPGVQIAIDDLVAGGDRVAIRRPARGTHLGELLGIAPTGKHIRFTGMTITRIAGNKIVESWLIRDGVSVPRQIEAF